MPGYSESEGQLQTTKEYYDLKYSAIFMRMAISSVRYTTATRFGVAAATTLGNESQPDATPSGLGLSSRDRTQT
jgi:hypothetical protein